MSIKQVSAVLAATVFLGFATLATADVGDWYIAPGAIYVDDDEDRGVEDDFAGGELRLGYAFHEHWNYRGFWQRDGAHRRHGRQSGPGSLFEFGANLMLVAGPRRLHSVPTSCSAPVSLTPISTRVAASAPDPTVRTGHFPVASASCGISATARFHSVRSTACARKSAVATMSSTRISPIS